MAETLWYSLAEAAKATRIPRGRLDHACRVGRLPYRRSETGARLLPQSVIEKLKKQGLAAFPRPYDPVAVAAPEDGASKQADRAAPAERIGLLGEPSAEIVKAKERTETAKLKVEEQKASLELAQLARNRAALYKEAAAERQAEEEQRRAEREAEAEWRREQAEQRRRAVQAQREQERRARWLKSELSTALRAANYEIWRYVPREKQSLVEDRIEAQLAEEMRALTPDSDWTACRRARQAAIERELAPYKAARAIEESLAEIPRYLGRLYQDGYINLRDQDGEFLARRMRPRVQAELQRQAKARAYRLSEEEARQLVRDAVDRELKLA